ncbi:MAG: hypothetical protein COB53_08390 [Elusimicrobia bacterium]|nr:MAG: hypothetical protein COB53_08390 [Elusimicrobiota bacterium]
MVLFFLILAAIGPPDPASAACSADRQKNAIKSLTVAADLAPGMLKRSNHAFSPFPRKRLEKVAKFEAGIRECGPVPKIWDYADCSASDEVCLVPDIERYFAEFCLSSLDWIWFSDSKSQRRFIVRVAFTQYLALEVFWRKNNFKETRELRKRFRALNSSVSINESAARKEIARIKSLFKKIEEAGDLRKKGK